MRCRLTVKGVVIRVKSIDISIKGVAINIAKGLLGGFILLSIGCSNSIDTTDLADFIAKEKVQSSQQIDPLPPFRTYKAFVYGATALRAPFDAPIKVKKLPPGERTSNVKPDFNRPKEFLEEFTIGSLSMVGTITKDSELWILISAGDAGVFRVKQGNYIGKNHGRIVRSSTVDLDIIEVVPNGVDGWIQRPRTIILKERN